MVISGIITVWEVYLSLKTFFLDCFSLALSGFLFKQVCGGKWNDC